MLWVCDASALATLPAGPADLYHALTELVEEDRMTFCNQVLPELKRREAACYGWAYGVRKQRCHPTATADQVADVLEDAPELSDDDGPRETSAAYAVAQAVVLSAENEVTMVTEDDQDTPTRMCVVSACGVFDIETITLVEFRAAADV